MQLDTTTVTDLCSSVSKRLILKSFLPDEEASTTGFNAITQGPTSTNRAADYLSRIFVNPHTTLNLKLNDRIPVHYIAIQVLANTPDNALNNLAPDFILPTITIEPVENTVDIQIE